MNAAASTRRPWRSAGSLAWLTLGFVLSALIIAWIVHAIDPNQLALALQRVDWVWIGIALGLTLITYLTRSQRWIILLRPLAFRWRMVLRALLTGQLLNHLLPIRVGDVVRALLLGREPDGNFARVFGSELIEKAWDWLALCVLMLIAIWVAPLPDWFLTPARTIGLLAALVLLGFIAVAVMPEHWIPAGLSKLDRGLAAVPLRWRLFILTNLQRLLDSLTVLRRRDTLLGAALWTTVSWGLSIVVGYAVQRACGIDSWIAATLLLIVLMLGAALPPSIAVLGVFEGLSILVLNLFDVPVATALAVGLLLHLVVIVPLLICTALTWLMRSH